MNDDTFAKGMLLGVAYGDALGAPCEFNGTGPSVPDRFCDTWFFEKRNQYNFRMRLQPGQVTDDTEMTIALMRALSKGHGKLVAVKEYHSFVNSGTYCLGTNTKSLLHGYKSVKLFDKRYHAKFCNHVSIEEAMSNGHLMRISPAALVDDDSIREKLVLLDTMLTNPSRTSLRIASLYVSLLRFFLQSTDVDACRDAVKQLCEREKEDDAYTCFSDALADDFARDIQTNRGWCVHAMSISLWTCMHAPCFHQGIVSIIRRGGDTDTNAAIGGALLGAMFGENEMRRDPNVDFNLNFILFTCQPKIESGTGGFYKSVVRSSQWNPSELLTLLPLVRNASFSSFTLDMDISSFTSLIQRMSQKRITKSAHVVFVTGASRSGKTTFSRALVNLFKHRGMDAAIVSQDDFRVASREVVMGRKSWEDRNATDWNKMLQGVQSEQEKNDFVIVEGYCLFYGPQILIDLADDVVYMKLSLQLCKARRRTFPNQERYGMMGWESMNQYVEQCVWPFHQAYEQMLSSKRDKLFTFELEEDSIQRENVERVCEFFVSSKR